jgi:hypothetical protein
MIVILHPLPCQTIAGATKADLLAAFAGHVEVAQVNAESATAWPGSSVTWDDLLIVIFDASPFPDAGIRFISEYQNQRGENAMVLPVAIDPASQKPPKPAEGIKALLYDGTAAGERGRLANRTGGMLGLRVTHFPIHGILVGRGRGLRRMSLETMYRCSFLLAVCAKVSNENGAGLYQLF